MHLNNSSESDSPDTSGSDSSDSLSVEEHKHLDET